MNSYYELLFRELGLPDALVDCAMGKIPLPIASMVSPPDWFGFSPALCPVWSDPSLPYYLGVWKHWFTSRAASFVTMYVRSGRKVREIARTSDQFFCHVIMSAICVHDGVTPAIEQFASSVGVVNLSEIDAVSLKSGDDPRGYAGISQFRKDIPLATVTDTLSYTGGFPTGDFVGADKWWENSCAFEVPDDVLASWPSDIPQPIWLSLGDRRKVLDNFLAAGEYFNAWLTLNSPGWSIPDAKDAICALSSAANDPTFSLLAKAWVSVAEDSSGGY